MVVGYLLEVWFWVIKNVIVEIIIVLIKMEEEFRFLVRCIVIIRFWFVFVFLCVFD